MGPDEDQSFVLRPGMTIALVALCFAGCADEKRPNPGRQAVSPSRRAQKVVVLDKPIGIATVGGAFTPLVEAGQGLPFTLSETFTNKTNGGPEILVELSQKDRSGVETVASLIIAIPTVPDNSLQITVTLKISEDKKMQVKTTIMQTATVQEFGPFPVE
jgi:molecular chaperone DnaK (HSP70)